MIKQIVIFFRRVFNVKKDFHYQGFIYLDKDGNVVENEITDWIRWKDKICISAYSVDEAGEQAFKIFHFKYPELNGKIWLY